MFNYSGLRKYMTPVSKQLFPQIVRHCLPFSFYKVIGYTWRYKLDGTLLKKDNATNSKISQEIK